MTIFVIKYGKIPYTSPASQVTQKKIHIIRIKDEIKFLYKKETET